MGSTQRVSDEIWRSIPERKLPAGRVWALLGLVALLLVGGAWASRSGIVTPQLETTTNGGGWTEGSEAFSTVITLMNTGSAPTTLSSASASAPWLRLDRVTLPDAAAVGGEAPLALPVALGAGEDVALELWFTVLDCDAVDRAGARLTVTASSPVRMADVDVTPTGDLDADAPSTYTSSGADPWILPWPTMYAEGACAPPSAA